MIPALLTLGKTLSFMGLDSFYLELSALLFSFGVVIWWILTVRKHALEKEARSTATPPIPVIPIPLMEKAKKVGKQIARPLVYLIVGGVIGWGGHSWKVHLTYAKQFEEWKAQHEVYQKVFTTWLEKHPTAMKESSYAFNER